MTMEFSRAVKHVRDPCFLVGSHDQRCALEQFLLWVDSTYVGRPSGELAVVWTCPMARCRRPFSGQAVMLQHLRQCDELRSTEFWCPECFAVESFVHEDCLHCPFQVYKEASSASRAREFFSSMGSTVSANLISEHTRSEESRPRVYPPPHQGQKMDNPVNGPMLASSRHLDGNFTKPTLVLDPHLCANPRSMPPQNSHCLSVPVSSKAAARSRSQSPLPVTTQGLPTMLTPDWKHQSGSGSRSTSTDSWDEIASSECSDGFLNMDDPASVASPLPDELPTPKSASTTYMHSLVSANLKPRAPQRGVFAELEHDLYTTQDPDYAVFKDNNFASYQPIFQRDGANLEQLTLDANLTLTDDVEISFGFSTYGSQESATQVDHHWRTSPQSLIRATWSTLQIHLDSSLHKLGTIGQTSLVSQFSTMSLVDVVDRGISTYLEIMANGECHSPLNLICLVHLSYAMSLAIYSGEGREGSREFFTQAMSYGGWVERCDRQDYINTVDALWRPSDMPLTDVLGLLQGNAWVLNGLDHGSSLGGDPPRGIRRIDPMLNTVAVILDELEYAVLHCSVESEFGSTSLYHRHLKGHEMEVHRSQAFVLATTLILRVFSQECSDVPGFANEVADMLSRISTSHFSTARRVELEAVHIGRARLRTNRFLDHFLPLVRDQVDSLYARNPTPDSQRLAYNRDGGILMISLFRDLSQSMRLGRPLSVVTDMSSAMHPVEDFLGSMTPNIGSFSFPSGTGPFPVSDSPHPAAALQHGARIQLDPEPGTGSAMSTLGSVVAPSPAGSQETSSIPADSSTSPKIESNTTCSLCGYRPKGDPRWFGGSMAKHMKLQHATTPPKIYRCPYPGCTSQFQKRPDNLRQHQIEKGHFVDGQSEGSKRVSKRKNG